MNKLTAITQSLASSCLLTTRSTFNILQLTDLHLSLSDLDDTANVATSNTKQLNTPPYKLNCRQRFERCLTQALNDRIHCDLILLTGDLVNEVRPQLYDYIFAQLRATGIPFACIAGNHDVTDVLDKHLPYEQWRHVATDPDPRLLDKHRIDIRFSQSELPVTSSNLTLKQAENTSASTAIKSLHCESSDKVSGSTRIKMGDEDSHIDKADNKADWALYLLDSSKPGKVYGHLKTESLQWLAEQLTNNAVPSLVVIHHHSQPVGSVWMDKHILDNYQQFWEQLSQFPHVKAVLNGHVHQLIEAHYLQTKIYATPATCYQFKPYQTEFALDETAQPGYRWLQLSSQGKLQSWVARLD